MDYAYGTNTFMAFWYSIFIFLAVILVIKFARIKFFKPVWTKVVAFAIVCVVTISISTANLAARFSKAEFLINCCEQYKQKYGEYPEKLVDIVPEFYNSEQALQPTYYWISGLHYSSKEGRHVLGFVSVAFLKTDYNFETKTWRSWD